jgi:hypothetical protein
MTWAEMNEAIARQPVIILPGGLTEQHGRHLAFAARRRPLPLRVSLPGGGAAGCAVDVAELAPRGCPLVSDRCDKISIGPSQAHHRGIVADNTTFNVNEPWFYEEGADSWQTAIASYTALPQALLFAKTQWLCDLVAARHGVAVHKGSPSIDHALCFPASELLALGLGCSSASERTSGNVGPGRVAEPTGGGAAGRRGQLRQAPRLTRGVSAGSSQAKTDSRCAPLRGVVVG